MPHKWKDINTPEAKEERRRKMKEKYLALAEEAETEGDTVTAEKMRTAAGRCEVP